MKHLAGIPILIALLAVAALHAQEITGNISGTVTDPSGSIIPSAGVTAINTGTGVAPSHPDHLGWCLFPEQSSGGQL